MLNGFSCAIFIFVQIKRIDVLTLWGRNYFTVEKCFFKRIMKYDFKWSHLSFAIIEKEFRFCIRWCSIYQSLQQLFLMHPRKFRISKNVFCAAGSTIILEKMLTINGQTNGIRYVETFAMKYSILIQFELINFIVLFEHIDLLVN